MGLWVLCWVRWGLRGWFCRRSDGDGECWRDGVGRVVKRGIEEGGLIVRTVGHGYAL